MPLEEPYRLQKDVIEVADLHDRANDRAYWLSRPAAERFAYLEYLRQMNYEGYDPATSRLQRVFEVLPLKGR